MEGNQNFHRADCALPTFTSEVWEGFVFVSLGNPAPLASSLAPLSGMLGEYGIGDWRHTFELDPLFWDINWKIAFENASESYHHIGFHPQTLDPALPGLGTRTGAGGEAYNFHVVPGAEGFRFPEVAGASLSDEAMSRFFICAVYPGFVLVMAGANAVWFAIAPLSVGRTSLRIGQLNPAGYFDAPGLEDRIAGDRAVLEAILEEDKRGCALVQRGLSMPDAVAGPLSPLERPIAEFVRYLARRLVR
jgi:phenylpropionate dioxygenase-like ring-hydroxylating dioxygenase large terminal subunit